jgi:hypothetical protein
MAGRWMVFTKKDTFGPWGGARIREELRLGRIDPFDLVSQEGEAVRRPLVEVDAIFENSNYQPAELVEESQETPIESPEPIPLSVKKTAIISGAPRAYEALAAPGLKRHRTTKAPKPMRQYLIIRPFTAPIGPINAHDILRLWYANQLPVNSEIQRVGGKSKIKLRDFVGMYPRPSMVVATPAKKISVGLVFLGVMIALMLFMVGYWFFSLGQQWPPIALTGHQVKISDLSLHETVIKSSTAPQTEVPQAPTIGPMAGQTTAGYGPEIKGALRPDTRVAPEVQNKPLTPEPIGARPNLSDIPKKAKPATSSQNTTRTKSHNRTPKTYSLAYNPFERQTAAPPLPSSSNQTTVGVTIKAPPSLRGPAATKPTRSVSGSSLQPGAQVTIKRYTFSQNALNACTGKCKIAMNGPNGPVTVVFFKEAFAEQLSKVSRGATLTGQVRRDSATGEVQLLLQNVQ